MAENLPAVKETRVWSLGWEDPLEKEIATHSSILAWRIPGTEEPAEHEVAKSWLDTTEWLIYTMRRWYMIWEEVQLLIGFNQPIFKKKFLFFKKIYLFNIVVG